MQNNLAYDVYKNQEVTESCLNDSSLPKEYAEFARLNKRTAMSLKRRINAPVVLAKYYVEEAPFVSQILNENEKVQSISYYVLNEETKNFIRQNLIYDGIEWLQKSMPDFFPGCNYEIELISGEDEDEMMLALRVYGSLPTADFRDKRHAICRAMLEAGHSKLSKVISIFQWRVRDDERESVSRNRSLFE